MLDELHSGVINVEVGELDLGVFLGDFDHGLAPEHGVLQDVGLVDRAESLVASHGSGEGDVGDAHDFALLVDHGINGNEFAIDLADAFGLAKVDAAGEFTHTQYIKAVRDELVFNGGGMGKRRQADTWAEVGVEVELLT